MYNNIPDEMKIYPQWVVWKLEHREGQAKPTKIPYNARTGMKASVTDSNTWSSFNQSVSVVGNYSGIGFVLAKSDPYCFVDLDDTQGDHAAYNDQYDIFKAFDSYSECSPSGKGLHIIVRGELPIGRRRNFVEIYSSERYMTMTGDVFHNKPIVEAQGLLNELFNSMGPQLSSQPIFDGTGSEMYSDSDLISTALNASNGDKFKMLLDGNWQPLYQSQSEADMAYVNIVAFYTNSKVQVQRIWLSSALAQREKGKRADYQKWMIDKSFDNKLPPIDISKLKMQIENEILKTDNQITDDQDKDDIEIESKNDFPKPPGLLGEIADFIYQSAPRPVAEVAVVGAIGLMAGICGRTYNISGTGLNQYILLLAQTGIGKEAAASGIDKLMNAIKFQVPSCTQFVGPAEIASGQALINYMSKISPCFVSVVGEFGLRMQQLCSPRASNPEIALRRIFLDLYNKSGSNSILKPTIYADKDKNTAIVRAPAFSILGESVPERFFEAIDEGMISEGLVPRFIIIEYEGKRPPMNHNHVNVAPSLSVCDKLSTIIANVLTLTSSDSHIDVQCDSEALHKINEIDIFADKQVNSNDRDVVRQLWSRAHVKTLKLAALVAVGIDPFEPVVTLECVNWAYNIIQSDVIRLISRFEAGKVGKSSEESTQTTMVCKMISLYMKSKWSSVSGYGGAKDIHRDKLVPMAFIQRRLVTNASFKKDRIGPTNAIKRCMQQLIDNGDIEEMSKVELFAKYNTKGRVFAIHNLAILNGEY